MEWYQYFFLIIAGVFAGFVNTLAGSGSLITLPLLIFLGLPANVANGTNRIAILLQNIVGVSRFRKKEVLDYRSNVKLVIPAVAGSIVGALIAVDLDETLMRQTIGILLVIMFFIILWKPSNWLKEKNTDSSLPYAVKFVIFFLIGVYGGFIQAGVGFFLLSGLVLGAGYDLVRANAVKVFIILVYTFFALGVFMINDQVNYTYGLVLAAGNMAGAWIGAGVAVKWGPVVVRYILLGTILVASAKMLGLF